MRAGRLDRRGKIVLSAAAVVAVLVNAGVVWVYWSLRDAGTATTAAGSTVELTLLGRPDDHRALHPGATADLSVTVTNPNPFTVRITSVSPGAVTADPAHRGSGCRRIGMVVAADVLNVSWQVPGNTAGVFTVPGALRVTGRADPACRGAAFTVPVTATAGAS